MKKIFLPSQKMLVVILASISIISASSYSVNEAMAFPHASLILVPDEGDPRQEHANPIQLVLGHTNEPAFGKLPGIHDGKHFVEIDLTDAATVLPIQGNNETSDPELELSNTQIIIDKYYFKDIESFQNAQSLEDADAIERNVPMSAVFGQPGLFYNRQVVDEGIYGYTIRGVINYYGVANVPIEPTTKFCTSSEGDTSEFDSEGWTGSFGCVENIKDIFFPPASKKSDGYPPKYDNGYGNNYGYSNSEEDYENPKEQYQSSYDQSDSYENGGYENPKEQYQ
ncbi:MAG TPA: hypothetical protein VLA74_08125 [Nitrososphaeraceae archaeon]|nr:hypothetical protein [Nitrososphaeraceae archaeon]